MKARLASGTVLVPICVLMVQRKRTSLREANSRISPRIALEGEKRNKNKENKQIKSKNSLTQAKMTAKHITKTNKLSRREYCDYLCDN